MHAHQRRNSMQTLVRFNSIRARHTLYLQRYDDGMPELATCISELSVCGPEQACHVGCSLSVLDHYSIP